ncbi:hypothetical protein BO78DRAFT_416977 [Aspergillus sclerotiicarbonarius CBS 121057]|uniref:Uncharacterized protein n=1 Tax=Aspergillus sclerotiicarbonarius (strain CBS 121057 / IBT 28362) TaxID=1448318 RepID=A0A319EFF2_ASPSB|nr:hypothetical protein BO78DRAFT_416977 [Aspergillus sclerotiicarbonarius CBS 121057]
MKFDILFIMTLLVAFVASAALPDVDDTDVDVTLSDEDWSDLDLDFLAWDMADDNDDGDDGDDSDVVARDEDLSNSDPTLADDEGEMGTLDRRCHRRCQNDSHCCHTDVCFGGVCIGPGHYP